MRKFFSLRLRERQVRLTEEWPIDITFISRRAFYRRTSLCVMAICAIERHLIRDHYLDVDLLRYCHPIWSSTAPCVPLINGCQFGLPFGRHRLAPRQFGLPFVPGRVAPGSTSSEAPACWVPPNWPPSPCAPSLLAASVPPASLRMPSFPTICKGFSRLYLDTLGTWVPSKLPLASLGGCF